MEYNTTKESLILPEYGRNVQMMAEHLLTIPDKANRTEAAKELIAIMINMYPAVRETKGFKPHRFQSAVASEDHEIGPGDFFAVFLLDRPQ